MFCKNCGSQLDLDDSAQYCASCGYPINKMASSTKNFVKSPATTSYQPAMPKDYKISQLKGYIQIIAVFEVIIGAFLLIGSVILFAVRNYAIHNVSMQDVDSVKGFNFGMGLLLGLGLLLLLYAIFVLSSGIGLLKGKKWSRTSSLVVGGLSVFSFPLGTLFGCFTLYYLTRPEISDVLVN